MYLRGQYDEKASEDVDEIKEEVNGLPDIVIISTVELLHYQLSVKQNEPTEQEQAKVKLKLQARETVELHNYGRVILY